MPACYICLELCSTKLHLTLSQKHFHLPSPQGTHPNTRYDQSYKQLSILLLNREASSFRGALQALVLTAN